MKVPAECPGEQTKEERKKLKHERQAAANSLLKPSAGAQDQASELPALSRENTMNSLSSGYAASAQRSISGPMSPTEEVPLPEPASMRPASTISSGVPRKSRVVAPPPSTYISELQGSTPNGSGSSAPNEQKGKMLYAFESGGEGELSVPEGSEVVVLEPDSKFTHHALDVISWY